MKIRPLFLTVYQRATITRSQKIAFLARRLAERGVRFIQVYHSGWDHHSNVKQNIAKQCKQTDQACAALLKDLKTRGLLEDTLVVWGGEFGRTPMVESSAALGRKRGRDLPASIFHVVGWWWNQSRPNDWRRPTNWDFTRLKTLYTFTTCRQLFFSNSGLITNGSYSDMLVETID